MLVVNASGYCCQMLTRDIYVNSVVNAGNSVLYSVESKAALH